VALVSTLEPGAIYGLLESIAGKHAKNNRDAGIQLRQLHAPGDLARDVIEVSGLARRIQPMAITASAWPPSASFFAASGISKEPGTRTTATLFSGAPEASSAPSAPDSNRSVMKLLKRLTTNAKRSPAAFPLGRICLGVNDSFIAVNFASMGSRYFP